LHPSRRFSVLALLATLLISTFGAAQAQQTPTLSIDVNQVKSKVSPMLYGLMTEEINYSYDGGLYAEMVRNRTFRARRRDVPYWLLVEDGNAQAKSNRCDRAACGAHHGERGCSGVR